MAIGIWEFFLKYPPLVYEKGRFVFASALPGWLVFAAFSVVAVALWAYLRRSGTLPARDRGVLLALRGALFAVLLLLLLRPTLQVPVAVPQENSLGILIDDTRSMQIADGGAPRAEELLRRMDAGLLEALSERFRLHLYRFSGDAQRIESIGDLTFSGGVTRLGRALDQARNELTGVPLAGLVVISDGADHFEVELNASLLGLRSAGVPVHTVGVGREQFDRDIEIRRVSTPRSVLRGTSMMVDLLIEQTGYSGRTVPLVVEDEGRIVNTQSVELPRNGTAAAVRVYFTAEEPGWRRFTFRVPVQDGELISQNNHREALIEVRDGRQKVLYFEGEPRFEVKFLRRAVSDDPELQLVVLQRTAENKFLRLDVDDPEELERGFPTTREELFSYRALVLGSVEASYFTREQQRMIADFVAERGGSLLMLGGKRAFSEGGYADTPIADVLPVELESTGSPGYYRNVRVVPTAAGEVHAALQLASDQAASRERWETLPLLSTFNRVTRLKPGATTLLSGIGDGVSEGQVVLAWQRYGRGMSLAMPVQDTWVWQMHADVPVEDETHETLWRQVLRWLVNEVPDQLTLTTETEPASLNHAVQLLAELRDGAYRRVGDGVLSASIEDPDGGFSDLLLRSNVRRDGEYFASFVPGVTGLHTIRLQAGREGEEITTRQLALDAVDDEGEYFAAQMRAGLLRRVAEETGGRFYTLSNLARLPEEIRYSGSGITRVESYDLWDMPLAFLLLVGLVGAEWGYRRLRGLP